MRRLSILIVLVVAASAEARVVIRIPTVRDRCKTATSWEAVTHCLTAFGTPRVIASNKSARVVEVVQQRSDDEVRNAGTYLYVDGGKEWRLGGMYGDDGTLVGFEVITIAAHAGYRLDFAESTVGEVVREDNSATPALTSRRISVYCPGDSYECTEAITACDILVRGKAYRTFRGVVRIVKEELEIVGDRTHAGDCAPVAKTSFRWPAGS